MTEPKQIKVLVSPGTIALLAEHSEAEMIHDGPDFVLVDEDVMHRLITDALDGETIEQVIQRICRTGGAG